MAQLIPIDHDPFSETQQKLVPVDHDPFADNASGIERAAKATLNQVGDYGKSIASGLSQIPAQAVGFGGDIYEAGGRTGNFLMNQFTGQNREYQPSPLAQEMITTEKAKEFIPTYDYEPQTGVGSTLKTVANVAGAMKLSPGLQSTAKATAEGGKILAKTPPVRNIVEGGSNVAAGFRARTPEELAQASTRLKNAGSGSYEKMKSIGANIKQDSVSQIVSKIEDSVNKTGKLNPSLHGDYLSVLDDLKGKASQGNLTLEELDQYRQLLGDVVKKNTTKLEGSNPAAFKAKTAIDALDDAIDGLSNKDLLDGSADAVQALNNARFQWSKSKNFEKISNLVEKADGNPNRLKIEFKNFVNNKNNLRGFSKEEVDALKKAASYSSTEQFLNGLGKFGFSFNKGMSPTSFALPTATSVYSAMNPAVAPLVLAGTVAKQGQRLLAKGKAEKALRMIEGRTPKERLAEALNNKPIKE